MTRSGPSERTPAPAGDRRPFLNLALALLVLLGLFWLGRSNDAWRHSYSFTGQQPDYYNRLVDGFLKGNLYMDVEVHPGLLSDDLQVRLRSPFLLDANLYQGKYYLYYGVVPAALVMLPYSALTGHDLSLNAVVVLFIGLGFLAALAVFNEVRRRHFPHLSRALHVSLVALLGFGTATAFLATRGMFYEAPIAAGYAFCMAAIWASWRALDHPARALRALAVASLGLSVAVGCRPNYLFALPGLLIPGYFVWRALRQNGIAATAAVTRVGAALLLPALVIGSALAWYNYARFGNPLEFGFRYGMNTFFWTDFPLASVRFVWPNLTWYYFSPPAFSPYFPFFFPINASFRPEGYYGDEAMHGQFAVFVLLVVVILLGLRRGVATRLRPLVPWLLVLGVVVVTSLAFMLFLTIRGNRYMVDFHASLVLGLVCVAGIVATLPRRRSWFVNGVIAGLAWVAVLTNLGASLQQFDDFRNRRTETFASLSSILNQPGAWAASAGLLKYGPVSFDVTFQPTEIAKVEPLLVAGTPYYSDGLFVAQHPGNYIEFQADHHGYGGPRSELMQIEPGRTYRIRLDMGALYPPAGHPFMAEHPAVAVARAKNFVKVTMDDKVIVSGTMGSYDAPPWTLQLGTNFATLKPFGSTFSGQVSNFQRHPIELARGMQDEEKSSGLWSFLVRFAPAAPGTREPVIATGITGAGILLLTETVDESHVRLGMDFWAHRFAQSEPVAIDRAALHELKVFAGPLVSTHAWPEEWAIDPAQLAQQARTLRVWLGSELIWTIDLSHHLESFSNIEIGRNPTGFSTAGPLFTGELHYQPWEPGEARGFIQDNLALPPANQP